MPSDTTLPQTAGWVLWYIGELAFKWVPGFVVSLTGVRGPDNALSTARPPTITEPVRVQDVVQFLQSNSAPSVYDQLYHDWNVLVGVSIALSLVFAAILIYALSRVFQIRQSEYKHFQAVSHTVTVRDVPRTRLRWERILEQAASESEQNRRLAILEADIMLGELLENLGYRGETMADKMRQVERSDFSTIDLAWEAHRARNTVAHQAEITISPHEATRVISLYDKVFREFGFIEKSGA